MLPSKKENKELIQSPLDKISQLNGVSFDYKDSLQSSIGLIAEDVEKVYPEIIEKDGK